MKDKAWNKNRRISFILRVAAELIEKNGIYGFSWDASDMIHCALLDPSENNVRNAEWELGIEQPKSKFDWDYQDEVPTHALHHQLFQVRLPITHEPGDGIYRNAV